uniref:Uncharacterized protein n=1 Tax=Physcomitrium patens TaxID=3218 RepID=A0A7I4ECD0_PHYPA
MARSSIEELNQEAIQQSALQVRYRLISFRNHHLLSLPSELENLSSLTMLELSVLFRMIRRLKIHTRFQNWYIYNT